MRGLRAESASIRQLPASGWPPTQPWCGFGRSRHIHPIGEAKRRAFPRRQEVGDDQSLQVVDTLGGHMHVRWDEGAAATLHGQLVSFADFVAATGVFERWVASCLFSCHNSNDPDKRDVLGTLMLGQLAGHRRYAHLTAPRGNAVAAQALRMNKVVSQDALR